MAILSLRGSPEAFDVGARCLIGRAPSCDVRIDDPRVSTEHAAIRWTGAGWGLRDLGSRNGTYVGDRRLGPGDRVALSVSTPVTLGAPGAAAAELALTDASPPVARARSAIDGVTRVASGGLIALPDDEDPEVSVVEARDGRWVLEAEGEVRYVRDRETVTAGGHGWVLDLPEPQITTLDANADVSATESMELLFEVSRDEERVAITVTNGKDRTYLAPRSHHYMLLTLARARLGDGAADEQSRGWLDRDDLCRMLAVDECRLNVEVCRARKQFSTMGVSDAVNVVERRVGTGMLRLGVGRVEVRRV